MDTDVRTNDYSKRSFKERFGPTYYAFDRGKIHYVVLDDVFFLARSYLYAGYLEERQLRWLEQDLASVPAGSTVVVCLHIPTWSCAARRGEWGKEQTNKVLNNRRALYKLLEPYQAHILSAHEHYNENYTPVPHVFEHVHAPLSTLFWQTPLSMDGIPAGYAVYEADGGRIASWYWKAVDHDRGRQFTAYAAGADRHKPDVEGTLVRGRPLPRRDDPLHGLRRVDLRLRRTLRRPLQIQIHRRRTDRTPLLRRSLVARRRGTRGGDRPVRQRL